MAMEFDRIFDRGIDTVSRAVHQDTPLPSGSRLLPAARPTPPELDELILGTSSDDLLDQRLRPSIPDSQLLTPLGFQRALQGAIGALRGEIDGQPDSGRAKLLGKAARVLNDEAGLRELLTMYRSMLYAG